jgi:hypothetical protein
MIPSIGFDMDQCLVEAFNLVPFILFFEINLRGVDLKIQEMVRKSRDIFYELVAENEVKSPTIFRPSIIKLMPDLIRLRKEGKIKHMFIYSNNGYVQILNAVDTILALIMKKLPRPIDDMDLIKEDGRLHVLTPRIYIDSPCRANTEQKIVNFREKSLAGIQECLNESIAAEELWFLDDSLQHTDLKNKLGSRYINVEAYKVHISNRILVEFFIKSFPKEVFLQEKQNKLYTSIIPAINTLFTFKDLPFNPSGREGEERMVKKFHDSMSKSEVFKPNPTTSVKWSESKILKDYNKLKHLVLTSNSVRKSPPVHYQRSIRTPNTSRPVHGGSPNSRRRRFRILRTRRKSRK